MAKPNASSLGALLEALAFDDLPAPEPAPIEVPQPDAVDTDASQQAESWGSTLDAVAGVAKRPRKPRAPRKKKATPEPEPEAVEPPSPEARSWGDTLALLAGRAESVAPTSEPAKAKWRTTATRSPGATMDEFLSSFNLD